MGILITLPGDSQPTELTNPANLSTAGQLVEARFNTASDYAADLWSQAQQLIADLGNLSFNVEWEPVDMPDIDPGGLDGISAEEPTPVTIDDVEFPTVEYDAVPPDPVAVVTPVRTPPDFNVPDPEVNIPDPPDVTWPIYNLQDPVLSDIDVPEAPTITLPTAPQLSEISIPSPPEYNIPEFEWELPTEDLTPPDTQFVYNEAEYDSDIRQALATKLYNDIILGGSGLDEDTEQAIYDRAVARQTVEEQALLDKTMDFFADRLYELPPGALVNQMLEMNNKVLQVREDLNNDILIQQSKLAQDNTHFIIDRAIVNEKNLMDYINQFQNRALDAAKFTVQAALLVYSAQVEAYKARLAVYVTQAEVYKARITGEIAKAEFYKAQCEGLKASAEIQESIAKVYIYQVEGVKAYIDIYKAQMEGAALQAKLDETRIAAFAALVQAFSVRVTAASERYKGYQAQLAGEIAKADLYKAQVSAYASRVDAYKSEIEADTMVINQQIQLNKDKIAIFQAKLQKYLSDMQGAVAETEAKVKIEGLNVDVYKALADNYGTELDALTKVYAGKIEEAKAKADIEIKEADLYIRQVIAQYDLALKSITAAAQVASQMAAAAISGVSASANIQHSESRADSRTGSYSESYINQDVKTDNFSIQHIYTHEED